MARQLLARVPPDAAWLAVQVAERGLAALLLTAVPTVRRLAASAWRPRPGAR